MTEYAQGSSPRLYATFVDEDGEAATVSGTPTVTVRHWWGNSSTIDVISQDMTLISGTTYYYTWNIPSAADKTTYTAEFNSIFSGVTAAAHTHALGAFDFQVIPRKFYDKIGGGFVQRIMPKSVWTEKEKREIIGDIESLLGKSNKADFKIIESKILGVSTQISDKFKLNAIEENLSDMTSALTSVSIELSKKLESQDLADVQDSITQVKGEIDGYKGLIKKLSEKEITYDDSNVVKRVLSLTRCINDLDTNLRNERITHIIAGQDDIRKEVDELKEAFVLAIPREVLEKIKNADEGIDSERV